MINNISFLIFTNKIILLAYKVSLARKIIYSILFIRFIFFSKKYNIKTAFYISCMTSLTGLFWYNHLKMVLKYYKKNIFAPIRRKKNSIQIKKSLVTSFLNKGKKKTLVEKLFIFQASDGSSYFIDPISMILSLLIYFLSESDKEKVLSYHSTLYNKGVPMLVKFMEILYEQLTPLYTYAFLAKIGRTTCPYFVRWHWMFLFLLDYIEKPYANISRRAFYLRQIVLLPKLKSARTKDIKKSIKLQKRLVFPGIKVLCIFHLLLLYWGLFSSVCGQYFYIPFFVDNLEYAIGFRPIHSIYTLGKTPWQDKRTKEDFLRRDVLKSKHVITHVKDILQGFYGYLFKGTSLEFIFLILIHSFNIVLDSIIEELINIYKYYIVK
uniref:Uncharacterized protein n=1 Tax=Nitzschia sp. PL1-4 TaxID=2083272 RepID=A0A2Z5ZAB4_9STRA|nr:hypothetical protein Ycf90 [Nitzschia sp. PL1-4]